jgi:hypothetical protein
MSPSILYLSASSKRSAALPFEISEECVPALMVSGDFGNAKAEAPLFHEALGFLENLCGF